MLADGADGGPYASLVLTACDHDGSPLLLLSGLAEHTKNLSEDPRLSLLFDGSAGYEDPLTGPRLTVVGRVELATEARHRARFLARHPTAEMYADFGDFRFHRVAIARAHLVAGFGRIRWLAASTLLTSPAAALIAAEPDIVQHMNEDHPDALDLYASVLLGLPGTVWKMTGIDPLGCDFRRAGTVARLDFAGRVDTPEQARAELVRLAHAARDPSPDQGPVQGPVQGR